MLLPLESLFYFMTEFLCNTSQEEKLTIYPIYDEMLLSFAISREVEGLKEILSVHLTIDQAEQLMDEIHKALIKLEKGE